METANRAKLIFGDKLYQRRARKALPILVRQAQVGEPITYESLARELAMPNPRNLNYVLGSIGATLEQTSRKWPETIPPVQALVINKVTGMPGEGVSPFLQDGQVFRLLPSKQKRVQLEVVLQEIFMYPRWADVLDELGLAPSTPIDVVTKADEFLQSAGRGGGEGREHQALKERIEADPTLVGIKKKPDCVESEYPLLSDDRLDVHFVVGSERIAVEVKSRISSEQDVVRGLFQCVKYLAVMEAEQAIAQQPQNARAVLVFEGTLSPRLVAIKNTLGVEVIELEPTD